MPVTIYTYPGKIIFHYNRGDFHTLHHHLSLEATYRRRDVEGNPIDELGLYRIGFDTSLIKSAGHSHIQITSPETNTTYPIFIKHLVVMLEGEGVLDISSFDPILKPDQRIVLHYKTPADNRTSIILDEFTFKKTLVESPWTQFARESKLYHKPSDQKRIFIGS